MRSGAGSDPRSAAWLTATPYAHRGLHGPARPENSRTAFQAALDAGFGIELDVRASRCGTAFVFHDRTLERLCGQSGSIETLDRDTLAATTLGDGGEPVPTLDAVLALVGGRTPLLIELKSYRRTGRALCRAVAAGLESYAGPVAVMSFDARTISWFARHAPQLVRGLVISEEGGKYFRGLLARRLGLIFARPRFLAYDVRSLPSSFAARARARGLSILTWTVRSEADRAAAAAHADQIIFEDMAR